MRSKVAGFTLIELLVVVSVIVILTSMAAPILSIAQRSAKRTNTQATIRKIDVAIGQFRRDVGAYPYNNWADHNAHQTDPEATVISPSSLAENRLYLRLASEVPNRLKLNAAVAAAQAKYAYVANTQTGVETTTGSPRCGDLAYTASQVIQALHNGGTALNAAQKSRVCTVLNRMGSSRASIAILAGALDATGGPVVDHTTNTVRTTPDRIGTPLIASPDTDLLNTGWCDDYLLREIPASYKDDSNNILDAYGRPLIYICQVLPKVRQTVFRVSDSPFATLGRFDALWYGLGSQGWKFGLNADRYGPYSQMAAANQWRLMGSGRIRLSLQDAGDGLPTPACSPFFPDRTVLMGSDRRYYAAPGMETEYEIWSAGPDGNFSWMRNALVNRDNVSSIEYDRGL